NDITRILKSIGGLGKTVRIIRNAAPIHANASNNNSPMQAHTHDLLDLARDYEALTFGEYTLKSGRISPYFFNLGAIDSGAGIARLARCYASALERSGMTYDSLFGPAYKGI